MNRQQLLSRLGVIHNILYSNGIWYVWDRHDPEWKEAAWWGHFTRANDVWVDSAPRLLMRWPRFPVMDRVVRKLSARRWRRKLLNGVSAPCIAYVFYPEFEPYVDDLGADFLVYHAYDLYSHSPGWSNQNAEQEARLLARADLVLASSSVIAQHLVSISGRPVKVLSNAVDFRAYSDVVKGARPAPDDLAGIPHPRIGYTGSLNRKVDFPLLAELAVRRPDWQFVLVGEIGNLDQHSLAGIEACRGRSNVHFLGYRDIRDIPLYIAGMDVNIMIYRISDQVWTSGIYPLKLHDYMAAGRPVVSADVPAVHEFSSQLAIAGTTDEWEAALLAAIAGGGQGTFAGRREVASHNTWDARVSDLNAYLQNMVSNRCD